MHLDQFTNPDFDRGASKAKEALWLAVSGLLVASWLPGSGWRRVVLRAFGASIGRGVVIKPGVRVKFPWKLVLGDHVWIGEDVWIDNLDEVTVGAQSCLSQGAYLCTGSHDWSDPRFGLVTKPIRIEGECWIGAQATLAPGTIMERGAVLKMGATASGQLCAWSVHSGNPDTAPKPRVERTETVSATTEIEP